MTSSSSAAVGFSFVGSGLSEKEFAEKFKDIDKCSGLRFPLQPRPQYMREIGAMWQIGVLAWKPCTFLAQNGSFSALWRYKNKERLSRGVDLKWHMPSTCLDAPEVVFYWNRKHNQGFRVAMARNP